MTEILTTTQGQQGLPRYFAAVFSRAGAITRGRLDVVLPDGRRFRAEGAEPGHLAEIRVHDPGLFARLIREGDLGFCDAYIEGGWTTPDLMAFMDFIQDGAEAALDGFPGQRLLRAWERLRFRLQGNSKGQARRNIARHYDLGNAFYELWLDETMTYSSALFDEGAQSLEAAQRRKYDSIIDEMGAKPGDHVLEIGCGWGGFAEHAAGTRGLRVTGLTISREQYDFAAARIAAAGLQDRVTLKLQDYRDERGHYDGIASIEMFEAVGERYWPVYFETLKARLKPGRQATLQVITIAEERWEAYRGGVDFIQRYIFPGGMLPSPSVLRAQAASAGLGLVRSIEFGESYSRTLRHWYDRFEARRDEVAAQGFDQRFRRMWDLYLCACAGAFSGGNCDVTQITLARPA
ncbi:SAM-dependent methyltransferase [Pseudoroseicyclus aestuarii]|uniref:Cyclopropane-fatty-acyl-phospholipid synthase n=1 Tax=Pseudoroseicyclus aestuarii TaxID=1795041 RepID=A0A318TB15_9RHOB|nr:cyclopropane-fatty-acyl-phospholipid synthase family protein [Pseudoroseicyclus aestuarii]PYE85508.1 cyclopropane-fatty-acyl-phospholipid synthase [Pseudoroseicyclus aestuarii]